MMDRTIRICGSLALARARHGVGQRTCARPSTVELVAVAARGRRAIESFADAIALGIPLALVPLVLRAVGIVAGALAGRDRSASRDSSRPPRFALERVVKRVLLEKR
jgi:hypothetical protein